MTETPPRSHPPPNIFLGVPGTRMPSIIAKVPREDSVPYEPEPDEPLFVAQDKADIPLLIHHWGSSAATVWLEEKYHIWKGTHHHPKDNPMVQGYLKSGSFIFAWGNPLTLGTKEAYKAVADEMWAWAKQNHKHLVWCCIDDTFAEVLAAGVGPKNKGWATLSCIQEDVLHPDHVLFENHDVKQNVRRAQKESVNVEELRLWEPDYRPDDITKKQVDEGLSAWKNSREGKHGGNIASASLDPWLDASNRRYYVARTPEKIVGILILTPIAHNSYQIKNCIAFPDSPRGTSEVLLYRVIKEMQAEGKESLTFGASATGELLPEHNLGGSLSLKLLKRGYHAITKHTGLTKRGEFRAKFDVEPERLHVSYPPHSFGWTGLYALMRLLRAK
ncbi:hypothetical protein OIV83_005250 [Microbotryomycetes sp. JL201]|nr:hypothetical protein OIV83_005250 [Microbotryomycetes sp. JL201]